jgi:hypothetical protein
MIFGKSKNVAKLWTRKIKGNCGTFFKILKSGLSKKGERGYINTKNCEKHEKMTLFGPSKMGRYDLGNF